MLLFVWIFISFSWNLWYTMDSCNWWYIKCDAEPYHQTNGLFSCPKPTKIRMKFVIVWISYCLGDLANVIHVINCLNVSKQRGTLFFFSGMTAHNTTIPNEGFTRKHRQIPYWHYIWVHAISSVDRVPSNHCVALFLWIRNMQRAIKFTVNWRSHLGKLFLWFSFCVGFVISHSRWDFNCPLKYGVHWRAFLVACVKLKNSFLFHLNNGVMESTRIIICGCIPTFVHLPFEIKWHLAFFVCFSCGLNEKVVLEVFVFG